MCVCCIYVCETMSSGSSNNKNDKIKLNEIKLKCSTNNNNNDDDNTIYNGDFFFLLFLFVGKSDSVVQIGCVCVCGYFYCTLCEVCTARMRSIWRYQRSDNGSSQLKIAHKWMKNFHKFQIQSSNAIAQHTHTQREKWPACVYVRARMMMSGTNQVRFISLNKVE